MDEHEDTPVVEVDVFVAHDAQLLPGAGPLAPALCHSGQPRPATGCGGVGSHKLDLGVCPLNRAEITAPPSCVDRPHQLQVLLRHPPPSLPPAAGPSAHSGSPRFNPGLTRAFPP